MSKKRSITDPPRPTKLKIGPYIYRIAFVDEAFMKERGRCDDDFLWIRVKADKHPIAQQRVTLLHEILHACFGLFDNEKIREWAEEDVTSFISANLFDVLANNPEVHRWLFHGRN